MVTFLEQQEWGKPRTQLELDQVEQKFQMRLNWERALLILITVSPSADDAQMRKIWQKEPGRQSHLWSNVPYLGRNLRRNLGRIVLQTTGEIIVGTFLAWYKVTRTSVCEFLFANLLYLTKLLCRFLQPKRLFRHKKTQCQAPIYLFSLQSLLEIIFNIWLNI